MTKSIDLQVFVTSGSKGGKVKGKSKRRGNAEFYRNLQAKALEARRRKKEAKT
jgi:hypothetical protein